MCFKTSMGKFLLRSQRKTMEHMCILYVYNFSHHICDILIQEIIKNYFNCKIWKKEIELQIRKFADTKLGNILINQCCPVEKVLLFINKAALVN